jgi:putative transposase
MSRKYKFYEPDGLYFVTFAVVNWIDVFIRNEYKEIILESWSYCMQNKGLEIFGWCIMTSHIHMIISSTKDKPEDIMRDMKSYTSNKLRQVILENPQESRKEWMLEMMHQSGMKNSNNDDFQFWQQHNHPILLDNNKIMDQKLDYIHFNPVEAGFVDEPEDYLYSSARDYAGIKGLIDISFIE